MITREQESHMRWAIALALEGEGRAAPNPMVGAVIVRDGQVVGEGYHQRAGTPHAEIHALEHAGEAARGADLYVTLEPCCHRGRTPPCVEAIIAAGVARVYVGTRDPNPLVNGRGIRALKRAGIEVIEGVLGESCREINQAYNTFIVTGRPFVTAKAALSLDGKLATASGESRWITNEECRRHVHRLRSVVDAVMVGGGTVRRDDPQLTARLAPQQGEQPKAIVVDERLNIPRTARLFKRSPGRLILATTAQAPAARIRRAERAGHMVLVTRKGRDGRVFLPRLFEELGAMGITSVLLEGGGELFADCFRRKLVDRVMAYLSPKLIGGEGLDFLPGIAVRRMRDVMALQHVTVHGFGDNVLIEGDL